MEQTNHEFMIIWTWVFGEKHNIQGKDEKYFEQPITIGKPYALK